MTRPARKPWACQPWAASLPLFLVVVVVGCWGILASSYSLADYLNVTHFAFEKVPGGFASPLLRATLLVFLLLGGLYAVGYGFFTQQPVLTRFHKLVILLLFLLPALCNVALYPLGALDVFNYLIELKLTFFYGQNPYLVTFEAYRHDPFALPAFLVDVPLFYGPVWLLVSGWPLTLVGFSSIGSALVALKVLNTGLLALTGLILFRAAPSSRSGWHRLYLLLANPLILFEGIGNAHNDVAMTLLLVSAVVALRRRSPWAGGALALSALVKPFSVVLFPLMLVAMARRRWGWRRVGTAIALCGVLTVLTVLPYWADGAMLAGWRQGTTESQQMDHVSPLSLVQQTTRSAPTAAWLGPLRSIHPECWSVAGVRPLSSAPKGEGTCHRRWIPFSVMEERIRFVALIVFVLFGSGVAFAVARGWSMEAAGVALLLAFLLLQTNLYPWYLIPVFALLVLRSSPWGLRYLFVATTLGLAYYPAYVFARIDHPWPELHRHLFLALFLTVPMLLYGLVGLSTLIAGKWPWRATRPMQRATRPVPEVIPETS